MNKWNGLLPLFLWAHYALVTQAFFLPLVHPELSLTLLPFSFSFRSCKVLTTGHHMVDPSFLLRSLLKCHLFEEAFFPDHTIQYDLPACQSYFLSFTLISFLHYIHLWHELICLHGEFLSFPLKWMFSEHLTLYVYLSWHPHSPEQFQAQVCVLIEQISLPPSRFQSGRDFNG